MTQSDQDADNIFSEFLAGGFSRRQALRGLGATGLTLLGSAAWPLLGKSAWADDLMGPGGIPLARKDRPVKLPLFRDPIKSGLTPESGTLKLYNFADYLDPHVIAAFESKYKVKVEVTTFDSIDEAVTRIATGQFRPDACNMTPDRLAQMVAGKLVLPLNHDYMPNLAANIWPVLQSPYYDIGSQYSIPYTVYTTGIGWRADKVSDDIAVLPNPWSIFWTSKKYAGYIGVLSDSRESMSMALLYNGIKDINTEDPALIAKGLASLQAMVPVTHPKLNITDYQTLGDATSWIHHAWSGNLISAARNYLPKGTDPNVLHYWAAEGNCATNNDNWIVLEKAEKPVLAQLWLNHLLDEKMAYQNFIGTTSYQPPQNNIHADDLIKQGLIPESLRTTILTADSLGPRSLATCGLTPKALAMYQRAYAQFVAGT
jgi:spermidine/putrescine transport system substrate-binding protein